MYTIFLILSIEFLWGDVGYCALVGAGVAVLDFEATLLSWVVSYPQSGCERVCSGYLSDK